MQTFITNLDFRKSAHALWEGGRPHNRLNNQINEALIILRTLTGWYEDRGKKGWPNHPVTKMWKGYEVALVYYITDHINVYELLSNKDQMHRMKKLNETIGIGDIYMRWLCAEEVKPPWLTEEFCSNHRAILLGKAWESVEYADDDLRAISTDLYFRNNDKLYKTAQKKFDDAMQQWEWYKSQGWTEQLAVRNEDSKWPYLWAVMV